MTSGQENGFRGGSRERTDDKPEDLLRNFSEHPYNKLEKVQILLNRHRK